MTEAQPLFSRRRQVALLLGWHAVLFGGYAVAWFTGDHLFALHRFAGYVVIAALFVRLVVGVAIHVIAKEPDAAEMVSPWRLPRLRSRPPLGLIALLVISTVAAAALSGWLSDGARWLRSPHEALAVLSLWVVIGHGVWMLLTALWRKLYS